MSIRCLFMKFGKPITNVDLPSSDKSKMFHLQHSAGQFGKSDKNLFLSPLPTIEIVGSYISHKSKSFASTENIRFASYLPFFRPDLIFSILSDNDTVVQTTLKKFDVFAKQKLNSKSLCPKQFVLGINHCLIRLLNQ